MDRQITPYASILESDNESSTSAESNDTESVIRIPPILRKRKPEHNWFVVPEILNRQIGQSAKYSSELFQRRCYGSLHCVERLELMSTLEHHDGSVNSLNFHPNGTLLASGSNDLKVVIWDWKVGKSLLPFETKHCGKIFQSKFLPLTGELQIATCAADGQVQLHQVSNEGYESTRILGSHRGPCHKLSVLDDQPHVILSAGEDGFVLRHDLRNDTPQKVIQVYNFYDDKVALCSISSNPSNNHEFCVGGRDHIVRTYDQRKCNGSRAPLHKYYPITLRKNYPDLYVTSAIYNYNGTEILASYNDDDIYLFDKDTRVGNFSHKYQGHRNGATLKGVNYFGPKSEFVVSGSDCGNVYFWDRNTEAIVQWMLADNNGVVNCLEPHPQLPFICTSGLDSDVKLWVPSSKQAPFMEGLSKTIIENYLSRFNTWHGSNSLSRLKESQMLWRERRRLSLKQREIRAKRLMPPVNLSTNAYVVLARILELSMDDVEVELSEINCSPS